MSDFNWCHGPECHQRHTLDRIRGVKGSKVLRTRKITLNDYMKNNPNEAWNYFCSLGCQNDFWDKYGNEIRQIAPRPDALETSIHDPLKKTTVTEYGYRYTDTKIEVDESRQID